MVYNFPIFDYDLEIIKSLEHYHVIVKAVDIEENEIIMLEKENNAIRNDEDISCIVKFNVNGNPNVLIIKSL